MGQQHRKGNEGEKVEVFETHRAAGRGESTDGFSRPTSETGLCRLVRCVSSGQRSPLSEPTRPCLLSSSRYGTAIERTHETAGVEMAPGAAAQVRGCDCQAPLTTRTLGFPLPGRGPARSSGLSVQCHPPWSVCKRDRFIPIGRETKRTRSAHPFSSAF